MRQWREGIRQDIRFAWRTARRSPGFVVAGAGTLALGIGATTAIFSILSGVLLRPLPFAAPERLVQVQQMDSRNSLGAVFTADMEDWRKSGAAFEGVAGYTFTSRNLVDVPDPERIQGVWAERSLFRVLGVTPLTGRTFAQDDESDVVVLSASLWKRRFGADTRAVGRKMMLDGQPFTIIGVMPESFQFPYRAAHTEMWVPLRAPGQRAGSRISRVEGAVARLKRGVTVQAAQQEINAFGERLAAAYPATNQGRRTQLTPLTEFVGGSVRGALVTLLGAVGLLLLIACANVANLLLARAARRTHEIAVRTALGASRTRMIQQLLTESMLLSMVGGLLGLLLAVAGAKAILRYAGAQIPRAWEIGVDWRVFGFLVATSAVTGVAFGILPALAASRNDPQTALKRSGGNWGAGGAGRRGVRDGLVVVEIALSFVLLASAGLLMRGFLRLQETPTGFVADHVLTARLTVSLADYRAPGSYGRYVEDLQGRLRQLPGVRSAGFIQFLPLQNFGWSAYFGLKGQPSNWRTELRYVSTGYFDALRIPVLEGRIFTERDVAGGAMAIVVNETLARRYFPNGNAVGQITDRGQIIGVVGDVKALRLDEPTTPEIYYSFTQNTAATSDAGVAMIVSAAVPPESLAGAVRQTIQRSNARQVVYDVKTMDDVVAASLANTRLYLWLIGCFAGLAVLLAASGVYGVISYVVSARTQEFGIRIALGAESGQILRFVLAHGGWLIGGGLVMGAAGTLATGRLLESLIRGVDAADAMTLAGTGVLLAMVGLAACLAPARRATRVDPLIALKCD